MGKKTLNASIIGGGTSIEQLIKNLRIYQKYVDDKFKILIKRLGDEGVRVVRQRITDASGDTPKTYDVVFSVDNDREHVLLGRLVLTSPAHKDSEGRIFYPHLAWEFGAGIYYNNGGANPYASELGMGVGKFPEQRFAIIPGYWWYTDESGKLQFSLGTEATMPMYTAWIEMSKKVSRIAVEVFR